MDFVFVLFDYVRREVITRFEGLPTFGLDFMLNLRN
jgi:hypothetical protein